MYKIDPRIYSRVDDISERLREPIDQKGHKDVTLKLDETIRSVLTLESKESHFNELLKSQICHLKEQIVSLYGKAEDCFVENEVKVIKEAASDLKESIQKNALKRVDERVKFLKKRISFLSRNHALSKKNRRTIAAAKHCLHQAHSYLMHGETLNELNLSTLQYLGEDEEAIGLYELAELFYRKNSSAQKEYEKLPKRIQMRVETHLEILKSRNVSTRLKMVQALIATAEEISDGCETRDYLSAEEIRSLFKEVEALL